jgi:hypothetical protein
MLKPAVKARKPRHFPWRVPAFAIADAAGFGPGFVFVPALPALFWRDSGELLRPKKAVAQWTELETQVGRVVNSQVAAPEPVKELQLKRSARRSRPDAETFRDPACHRPAQTR